MDDEASEQEAVDPSYRLRRQLSVVVAQATSSLQAGGLSDHQRESLETLIDGCYELTGALTELTGEPTELVSEPPAALHRVLVLTDSAYLRDVGHREAVAGVSFVVERSVEGVIDRLGDGEYDLLLVDAFAGGTTGFERRERLEQAVSSPPPFGLVSIQDGGPTPALGLSGVLDPDASTEQLDAVIEALADTDSAAVACVLAGLPSSPGEALDALLERDAVTVDSDTDDGTAAVTDGSDIVFVDTETYARLSEADISTLRGGFGAETRPLLLLAPVSDPAGRSWVPTVGCEQFRSRPVELPGLAGELLTVTTAQEGRRLDV